MKASVPTEGDFQKWNASFTVTSAAVESGVLDIEIQTDSVNTGSGMKDGKLKSKDFFNADQDPYITFHSCPSPKSRAYLKSMIYEELCHMLHV